jgi:glycosyltransferase involved in cell wall biosynthesis
MAVSEPTAAIILTHNRPQLLAECVTSIAPQVDAVLVVDNASEPSVIISLGQRLFAAGGGKVSLILVPDQPPNLSNLWNRALDFLATDTKPRYVAFLCDDTTVPDGWFTAVTQAMRDTGAAAGCSNPWGHQHPPRVKTEPDGDIMGRMPGWAFVLDTTKGIRADESMKWWFCDTDLDIQARQCGGMVMVGGYPVPNHRPGEYTNSKPELGEQAGRDREAFAAKYGGWIPW